MRQREVATSSTPSLHEKDSGGPSDTEERHAPHDISAPNPLSRPHTHVHGIVNTGDSGSSR